MSQYEQLVVDAVKRYTSPEMSWAEAGENLGYKESCIYKDCPLNTFLSLCEAGLVKGIPAGIYTNSDKLNVAKSILNFLQTQNYKNLNDTEIWRAVKDVYPEFCTAEDNQGEVAVVRGLFEAGYL